MSLGQSIRSGVKWLAFGKVGNRLFEFAFGVALARLLVPADFGMIVTIQIFTGFVGMFTAGGMGQSLIRAKVLHSVNSRTSTICMPGMLVGGPLRCPVLCDPSE